MRLFYAVVLVLASSGVYAMEIGQEELKQLQPQLYNKKVYLYPMLASVIPNRALTLNIMRARKNKEPHNQGAFEQLEQETLNHHMQLLSCAFAKKNHEVFKAIISNFSELQETSEYQNLIPLIRNKICIDSSYQENEWKQILDNYPPEVSH